MTPTARSLQWLADEGWTADIVERRVTSRLTKDFLGFVDIIALRGGETLAIQVTSASNVSARIKKIADSPHLAALREAGWTIHVHGWRPNGTLRVEDLS